MLLAASEWGWGGTSSRPSAVPWLFVLFLYNAYVFQEAKKVAGKEGGTCYRHLCSHNVRSDNAVNNEQAKMTDGGGG